MRQKIFLGITVFLLSVSITFSQEEGRPRQIENKWAVKITPTQMIMGELNLGIEFKVSPKTSIEIQLGPTISEVGFGGRIWENMDQTSSISRESSIGYFGALGFRYYPLEKTQAMTRLYIEPQLKYRVYNSSLSEETGLWGEQTSSITQYKFIFNTGYQLWATKSFGFDFYLGAGLGYRTVTDYSPEISYGANGYEYMWEENTYSKPQLLLNFGVKVAIGG